MPMCICLCFHNKSKRLEYLWWHTMCLVDWVNLLRMFNSHYLFVCLLKYFSIKNRLQVCSRVLGFLWFVNYQLESSTWNSSSSVKASYRHLHEGCRTRHILCMIVIMFWINLYFKLYLFPTLWIVNPYSTTK